MGKIGCAVHGIDDPAGIRQAQIFRALFSEESGLGRQGCISALANPAPTVAHFTIEHDGEVDELDGIGCMVGNTSLIQNDINLFPDCRMDDGFIDIAVIQPAKTVELLPTLLAGVLDPAGKGLGRPQFTLFQAKEARITCTPSLGMEFDGELIHNNTGEFGARVLPACLDLIVDDFAKL